MPPGEHLSGSTRHTRLSTTRPTTRPHSRTEEDRTVDIVRLFDLCLHSLWLLPVLAVMIAADGPVPVLPSETLLMSAAAAAFGIGDVRGIVGLFVAALVGSVGGDGRRVLARPLVEPLAAGRGAGRERPDAVGAREPAPQAGRRPRRAPASCPAAAWSARPPRAGSACRCAGSCPGRWRARRCGASTCSSSGWLLGPIVGGNPFLSLAAGVVMAVLTAGGFALVQRRPRGASPVLRPRRRSSRIRSPRRR